MWRTESGVCCLPAYFNNTNEIMYGQPDRLGVASISTKSDNEPAGELNEASFGGYAQDKTSTICFSSYFPETSRIHSLATSFYLVKIFRLIFRSMLSHLFQ